MDNPLTIRSNKKTIANGTSYEFIIKPNNNGTIHSCNATIIENRLKIMVCYFNEEGNPFDSSLYKQLQEPNKITSTTSNIIDGQLIFNVTLQSINKTKPLMSILTKQLLQPTADKLLRSAFNKLKENNPMKKHISDGMQLLIDSLEKQIEQCVPTTSKQNRMGSLPKHALLNNATTKQNRITPTSIELTHPSLPKFVEKCKNGYEFTFFLSKTISPSIFKNEPTMTIHPHEKSNTSEVILTMKSGKSFTFMLPHCCKRAKDGLGQITVNYDKTNHSIIFVFTTCERYKVLNMQFTRDIKYEIDETTGEMNKIFNLNYFNFNTKGYKYSFNADTKEISFIANSPSVGESLLNEFKQKITLFLSGAENVKTIETKTINDKDNCLIITCLASFDVKTQLACADGNRRTFDLFIRSGYPIMSGKLVSMTNGGFNYEFTSKSGEIKTYTQHKVYRGVSPYEVIEQNLSKKQDHYYFTITVDFTKEKDKIYVNEVLKKRKEMDENYAKEPNTSFIEVGINIPKKAKTTNVMTVNCNNSPIASLTPSVFSVPTMNMVSPISINCSKTTYIETNAFNVTDPFEVKPFERMYQNELNIFGRIDTVTYGRINSIKTYAKENELHIMIMFSHTYSFVRYIMSNFDTSTPFDLIENHNLNTGTYRIVLVPFILLGYDGSIKPNKIAENNKEHKQPNMELLHLIANNDMLCSIATNEQLV